MSMNPDKAECHGRFLYGAGYKASEDERVGDIVGGFRSFCNNACPKVETCKRAHRLRTSVVDPQGTEIFERQVKEYARLGIGENMVAMVRARAGNPDPYYRQAMVNFREGQQDRKEDGRVADRIRS